MRLAFFPPRAQVSFVVSKDFYNTAHFSPDSGVRMVGTGGDLGVKAWGGGGCGGTAARDWLKGNHSQHMGRGCCSSGARMVNEQ